MAETTRGVPYLEGTDPAAEINERDQAQAQWVNDNPGVAVVTTAQRDALLVWTGRTVYNTTTARHEVWNGAQWTAVGGSPIQSTLVDAKGDLLVGTADNTVDRLAVGPEGTSPVSRAAEATGIAWEAPGGSDWALIETVEVGTAVTEVSFTNIPQTYEGLAVLTRGRYTGTSTVFNQMNLRFNGDATAAIYGYGYHRLALSSPTVTDLDVDSDEAACGLVPYSGSSNDGPPAYSSGQIVIPDYRRAAPRTFHWHSGFIFGENITGYQGFGVGVWRNVVDPITSLQLRLNSHAVGCRYSLYGIK